MQMNWQREQHRSPFSKIIYLIKYFDDHFPSRILYLVIITSLSTKKKIIITQL